MMQAGGRLPKEYQEVSLLVAQRYQQLQTNVTVVTSRSIKLFNVSVGNNSTRIVAMYDHSYNFDGAMIGIYGHTLTPYDGVSSLSFPDGENIEGQFALNNGMPFASVTYNGQTVSYQRWSVITTGPIRILPQSGGPCQFGEFLIDNGEAFYGIPCYRKSDTNKGGGYYDLVSKSFYGGNFGIIE